MQQFLDSCSNAYSTVNYQMPLSTHDFECIPLNIYLSIYRLLLTVVSKQCAFKASGPILILLAIQSVAVILELVWYFKDLGLVWSVPCTGTTG